MATLTDRYANALLELSEEKGSLEEDLQQCILIQDALSQPDVKTFLTHPHIPDSAKYELFQDAFSSKISDQFMGFLHLTVRKNRESLIVTALKKYIDRANRRLGKIDAKVVSAEALKNEEVASIQKVLSKQTNMQVNVKSTVDPDVIGGFYILVDGRIFDSTVRSRLNTMRETLKRGGF